jgi:hypothetical protein
MTCDWLNTGPTFGQTDAALLKHLDLEHGGR